MWVFEVCLPQMGWNPAAQQMAVPGIIHMRALDDLLDKSRALDIGAMFQEYHTDLNARTE